MTLVFDETVSFATLNVSAITLVPQADSSTGPAALKTHTLRPGSLPVGQDGTSFDIVLSRSDLNALKLIEGLADSRNTTFISFAAGMVQDMSANYVSPRTTANGLLALSFTADTTAPNITSFDLDMNAGLLTLRFSEVVRASLVDVTQLTLQMQASLLSLTPSNSFTLGPNSTATTQNSETIVVTLGVADLNPLKSIAGLARSASSTFLSVGINFVEDMHANRVNPVAAVVALQTANFTADVTAPVLVKFVFDRNQGQITFDFSETVDETTFTPGNYSLQDAATASAGKRVVLAGTFTRSNLVSIVLVLNVALVNQIKAISGLATSTSNTFLTFAGASVRDMVGVPIAQVSNGAGIAAHSVLTDTVRPTLVAYNMTMTTQPTVVTLVLAFSETVDAATFVPSRIALQADASSGSQLLTLSAASNVTQSAGEPTKIVLTLTAEDVESIRNRTSLVRTKPATYLVAQDDAVRDASGLALVAVPGSAAMPVSAYNVDFVQPEVVGFDLDLNLNRVVLRFSETVTLASLQTTYITLQNSASNPTSSLTLGGSSQPAQHGANNSVVVVSLLDSDVQIITADTSLATNASSTFLSLAASAIKDVAENRAKAIPAASAVQVQTYIVDATRPALISFVLEMNTGNLTLTFSEVIKASTFSSHQLPFRTHQVVQARACSCPALTWAPL